MSEILHFPGPKPADPHGALRAAMVACDLLQRAEAQVLTAGVIAQGGQIKAACAAAQDAIHRAREIAERVLTNTHTTPPKGAA